MIRNRLLSMFLRASRPWWIISILVLLPGMALFGQTPRLGGVSLVSPPSAVTDEWCVPVQQLNAEWVAIMPYGFGRQGQPAVHYNLNRQWWGERFEGMQTLVRQAHAQGLKVMLKPMVWYHDCWPGSFELGSEELWQSWEAAYRKYVMEVARIASEEGVEMLCIGTEFKKAAAERPRFWEQLAADVRQVFSGPLTYAANWDNFNKVRFWDALDYIGIDAYFPLTDARTPTVRELRFKWSAPLSAIGHMARLYRKPVLFTEFGYRSVDRCTWRQWELEKVPFHQQVNLKAQENAYQAFFEMVEDQDWFAGVFIWQWYTHDQRAGGPADSDYTVQNKPAERLVMARFQAWRAS